VEGHGVGSIRAPVPRVCDKDKAGISAAAAAADRRRRRGGRSGLGFGDCSASAPLLFAFHSSSGNELGMAAGAVGFALRFEIVGGPLFGGGWGHRGRETCAR